MMNNADQNREEPEEKDALWRLLGTSPLPPVDPWFTVRTLARCRYETAESEQAGGLWFNRLWRWALGGGLSVALAIFVFLPHLSTAQAKQEKTQEAFEVMATLNTDVDSGDSSQDSSSL